jgi:hypothetical protein
MQNLKIMETTRKKKANVSNHWSGCALTRTSKLNFCAGGVRSSRPQQRGVGGRRENVPGLGRKTNDFTVGCCRSLLRGNKWIF